MLNFTCKNCGGHRLEEVMVNVVVASVILNVPEDGNIEYGEQTNDDGDVVGYQCIDCQHKICDANDEPITDSLELAEYLRSDGKS